MWKLGRETTVNRFYRIYKGISTLIETTGIYSHSIYKGISTPIETTVNSCPKVSPSIVDGGEEALQTVLVALAERRHVVCVHQRLGET